MPMALFNAVSIQHPGVTIQFLRLIASRLVPPPRVARSLGAAVPGMKQAGISGANTDLKTVCIMPTTRNIPILKFAEYLKHALEDIGAPTSFLTQGIVMEQLGRHAFSRFGNLKIASWLSEQEQRYRIVLYVVDTPVTSQWTTTAIRQVSDIGHYHVKGLSADKDLAFRRTLCLLSVPETMSRSVNTKKSFSPPKPQQEKNLSFCIPNDPSLLDRPEDGSKIEITFLPIITLNYPACFQKEALFRWYMIHLR